MPAGGAGVGTEAHAHRFGEHLVAGVLLTVGEQGDMGELFVRGALGGVLGRARTDVPGVAVAVGGVGVEALACVRRRVLGPAQQPGEAGELAVGAGGEVR